jgi:hypothetical protein
MIKLSIFLITFNLAVIFPTRIFELQPGTKQVRKYSGQKSGYPDAFAWQTTENTFQPDNLCSIGPGTGSQSILHFNPK